MLAPDVRSRVFLSDDALNDDHQITIEVVNAQSVERWDPPDATFDHAEDSTTLLAEGIRFEHWWLFDFTRYGLGVYGWLHEDRPQDWFWKIEIDVDENGRVPDIMAQEILTELETHGAYPRGEWIGEIFPFKI